MSTTGRPLSPHIHIYKPQLTSVLSILHRATGIFLCLGAVVYAWWVTALSLGPGPYEAMREVLGSWLGKLLLFAWTFSFFFHLCNGVRHLFWDAGTGFDLQTVYASGRVVVAASIVLTIVAFGLAYAMLGVPDGGGRSE